MIEAHINLFANVNNVSSALLNLHVVEAEHSCIGGLNDPENTLPSKR